jgi:hypothetical protein
MINPFAKREVTLAVMALLGSVTLSLMPSAATAQTKASGKYVAGDFHNHTTCSDGSISVQKLVDKSTSTWGLDWFVQAGHGNSGGSRNCTLTEDATLATTLYPFTNQGPETTWTGSIGNANVKGDTTSGAGYMWRWQAIQEYSYPLMEYLSAAKQKPLFMGLEENPWGHEHLSMSIIDGQMPPSTVDFPGALPATPGSNVTTTSYSSTDPNVADRQMTITGGRYVPAGNADKLAKHVYCFDSALSDRSRGNVTGSATIGNNWDCTNPNSASSGSASTISSGSPSALAWTDAAKKLIPKSGTGAGTAGDLVTQEAVKWMRDFAPTTSYFVPAHLERAGTFNPDGNNGWNVENLRNFNNIAPNIAFGFETQPGHGASANRGEYQPRRQTIQGVLQDSVGTTTYGGTGVYGAQIGGVWDAMLGEGRNFWFFASSDWHNRGIFGPDDRRSTQDFQPGEYQQNFTMVRNGNDKLRPQSVVDGLRTGNNWAVAGQLIDRLSFVVCSGMTPSAVQGLVEAAALNNSSVDGQAGCANMGEKLVVPAGATVVVGIAVRDPAGTNQSPYSFPNPSLLQIGINQPMNAPVLNRVDVIGGNVTGIIDPSSPNYAGAWPINANWLNQDPSSPNFGKVAGLSAVPAAAKNTSAAKLTSFDGGTWTTSASDAQVKVMTYTLQAAQSQYVRLRGSNMPPSVPYETGPDGNPLTDIFTNAFDTTLLRIPCTTVGTNVPPIGSRTQYTQASVKAHPIDGCPTHLPVATSGSTVNPIAGKKAVAYDVAAWADLWFYSNPVFIQVSGSFAVQGVSNAVYASVKPAKAQLAQQAKPASGQYRIATVAALTK